MFVLLIAFIVYRLSNRYLNLFCLSLKTLTILQRPAHACQMTNKYSSSSTREGLYAHLASSRPRNASGGPDFLLDSHAFGG
jgi:hypothetical protein